MTIPELPQDLVEEILCRVPATDLKRLRSTCKRWNCLFNDDCRFARNHFNKSPKQFMHLMLTKHFNIAPLSIDLNTTIPSVELKSELSLPDPRSKYSVQFDINEVIHCDGVLLCYSDNDLSVTWVWNPLTGEKRWIDTSNPRQGCCRYFDIGYSRQGDSSKNKSYKVLSCNRGINVFEMYDFNSDTWRSLGDISPGWCLLYSEVSVSLKGNTYMLAIDYTKPPLSVVSVLKIDYSTEKSVAVPLPYQCRTFETSCISVVREEKLSVLLQRDKGSKTKIWVTNKIDDTTAVVSWSKVFAFDLSPDLEIPHEGSFLLDEEKKVLVYCDTLIDVEDEGDTKNIIYFVGEDSIVTTVDFGVDKVQVCWHAILNYVPSLDKIKRPQGKRKRDHAFQEAKDWMAANTKDDDPLVESVRIPINPTFTRDTPPECQIDGSWHASDTLSGHGWIVMDKETPTLMGLKSSRRGLSPLQAEFETLLWAMECLISESKTSLGFATDCSELISLLDNPSEWPTLAVELQLFKLLKLSFPSFSIRFIPRCNNVRADCLAKKARARGSLFSHVSTSAPDWLSLEESLRPIT
ncbi:Ribonuclease H domain [Arabidopsis suecica]|uniref:Ribonuclease H domain n=1 Tax=Arabidopsis suecica TaxID=45249 RepID=A0A8T2BDT0_ARASU|nr:Ribonuclease H domain [Arabidopsis suecica]